MNLTMKYSLIILIFLSINTFAQDDFPLKDRYPFVEYEKNSFLIPGDSTAFKNLFAKFDTLMFYGTNQMTVVQIGASHTQADVFTGQLRMRLQTMYPGLSAGRGYVFPYNLIRTNSPYDYKAKHTGEWSVCRNVERKTCDLGLTGISATTYSEGSSISIFMRESEGLNSTFNYVKILHSTDSGSFHVRIFPDSLVIDEQINYELGYSEFWFKEEVKDITLKVEKSEIWQNYFSLYGIFLENTTSGIVFHPIGINGASTTSFNKATLFDKQMKAVNPDWVIIALGTNDGYTSRFDSLYFKNNFKILLRKIKAAIPGVAITIIVPNDDFYKRKYPNPNTEIQARMIIELAEEEDCSVWNMYEIMGGFNSSTLWLQSGLMAYDRIHFTNPGYRHLADLFFTAFADAYGEFMN
jgi:lysophospholipase L1-like esterase